MYLEDAKNTLAIINKIAEEVKSGYTTDITRYLKDFIREKEEELLKDSIEENTISLKDAPEFEDFRDWVYDILHDRITAETPHGEYGGDISCIFNWNGKEWDCEYSPDWNRHDKQFYFIDNFGNNLTIKEL